MEKKARALIVWGTTSGAGKSWLATALCRWAARRGVDVAPFKAQNMSNNARVVPALDGGWGEIGAAQYFQALAAGLAPSVEHNPVLLKPERDTASQVLLHGRVEPGLSRTGWRERSELLAATARDSLERLQRRHELLIIEGAGSPAEINLAPHDYVNLQTARWAEARALLVTDIDRGGAFAHLFGTWALLPEDLKPQLAGFVLNRFRGDPTLLAPAPKQLEERTGVPTLAVVPMWRDHGLPEEDGMLGDAPIGRGPARRRIAIVAYPHISNLDEFQPLARVDGVRLLWARDAAALEGVDCIILPGSKQVSGDLAWLRQHGMDAAIARHAAAGGPVLGVCGGLQMLGQTLADPEGHDGDVGFSAPGLGLLPLATGFVADKHVQPARVCFGDTDGAWGALAGVEAAGYEIHCGRTVALSDTARAVLHDPAGQPIGWQRGNVLGVYAHGLFESPSVLRALYGDTVPTLQSVFEGLADHVEAAFTPGTLERLLLG
jgi:adenosylcobyric acid synthase